MNIKQLLLKQAQNHPQKPAIIFEDSQISFSQLKEASFGVANCLLSKGLGKGDKVALYLPNRPETVFGFLGAFSAGLAVVPLDFMLTQAEVIDFINHSQAKALITKAKPGFDLEKVKKGCPNLKEIITDVGATRRVAPTVGISEFSEDSLAAIFYTSGSTGHPKGVMLNYSHLDNPTKTIDHFLKLKEEDVFLCGGVPFSHFGGLDYILLMLKFSTTMVLMERFHPLEFLKSIGRHKVTIFCIVPAMYVAILSLKGYGQFDLSSLKFAVVFGAPSSPVLLEKFHKVCPNARLSNGWGLTETAAPNCMLPPELDTIASIGKFAPGMEAKIVDGELLVKGEAVMAGYYKEPELTKEVMTDDGWFKTGDMARFDDQGLCYIVGRKKDMIKVAGEIVFPAEVEAVLNRFPKVKEAAVIGVADKLRGEVPKAFISLKENMSLNQQELKDFLKEKIAHFKIPHYFEVVKNLPKNRTGKIDKQKLKM